MKSFARLFAVVITLAAFGQENVAAGDSPAAEQLNIISSALVEGRISRIEIIQIPSNLETRAAISPEALERGYYTKVVVRDIAMMGYRAKLTSILRSLSVQAREYPADLRWGVVFYSREDKRIGALYFDRSGRYGAVNQASVSFDGQLFSWLSSNFSHCVE